MSIFEPNFQFSLIAKTLLRVAKLDLNPYLVPDLGYPNENNSGGRKVITRQTYGLDCRLTVVVKQKSAQEQWPVN